MDEKLESQFREAGIDMGDARRMYASGVSQNFVDGLKCVNLTLDDVHVLYLKFGQTSILIMNEMILRAKQNVNK